MNWKLVFQLSLFGLAMAVATVYWIPSDIEPLFWLVIFALCAYLVVKNCGGKYFLHGFSISVLNSVWITSAHILLYQTYIGNHPQEAAMMSSMPLPDSPRLMMLMMGPLFGMGFGIILGVFSNVASKVMKKK